jgi:ubiquinone/menaquinone biosynthesis C-methylase UbiE
MFELDDSGAVLPNPIFHRSFDRLHSRCIEYPFTASQLGKAERILDVGSVKADRVWINWLEQLPLEVHATDYDDNNEKIFVNSQFHQADLRNLPLPDNYYDVVMAVSVIEHIGLAAPQVNSTSLPEIDIDGDVKAFKELLRVLKPSGRLIVTFPYSIKATIIGNDSARTYDWEAIQQFNSLATPIVQDYYEYQSEQWSILFRDKKPAPRWYTRIKNRILSTYRKTLSNRENSFNQKSYHSGLVTWRRISINQVAATNMLGHIDGVLCGVWKK